MAIGEGLAEEERRGGGHSRLGGPATRDLELRRVDPPDEAPIDAADAIRVLAVHSIGVRQAEAGARADVALEPEQVVEGVVVARRGGLAVIHGREKADVGAESLPGELDRGHRLHDPAGVDELVRRGELLASVQEERPLLGEEDLVARIELKLPRVRLHLGKVGIRGPVQVQIVGDSPPHTPAELGRSTAVVPPRGAASAGRLRGERRIEVEHQPALQVGEPDQVARLAQERRARALGRRPGVFLSRVLHRASDVDAPALLLRRLEAQALERNPHLDLVPVLGESSLRFVHVVGTQVGHFAAHHGVVEPVARRRPRLHQRPIRLHTEGIHRQHRRLAAVVEGAEEDLHEIVGEDLVAIGQRGMHVPVRLECPDAEVDRVRRVPDEHLGRVGGRDAVHRRILREAAEHRRPRPLGLVQHAIDRRSRIESRRMDVEIAGAAVVDQRRIGAAEMEEQQG